MQYLALAGAVALAFASSPAITETTLPTPFFIDTETIPQIVCYGEKGGHRGTGVRISDEVLLSATHVTTGKHSCSARGKPLTLAHSDGDFAANYIGASAGTRMIVSCEGIKEGRDYIALGYAFAREHLVAQKLIGTNKRDGEFTRMNGRVFGGMSGGPVVDSEGRIVAIINQRFTEISQANVYDLKGTYLCR